MSYPNVANLRLRMPISDDLNARSLITKITKYDKVSERCISPKFEKALFFQIVGDIPNSMSVMFDLVPISVDLTLRNLKGV